MPTSLPAIRAASKAMQGIDEKISKAIDEEMESERLAADEIILAYAGLAAILRDPRWNRPKRFVEEKIKKYKQIRNL